MLKGKTLRIICTSRSGARLGQASYDRIINSILLVPPWFVRLSIYCVLLVG